LGPPLMASTWVVDSVNLTILSLRLFNNNALVNGQTTRSRPELEHTAEWSCMCCTVLYVGSMCLHLLLINMHSLR